MLRASQVNAPNHNNLDMPFNGEDKLTCARLSLGASAFPTASSSLGAWQLKVPGRRDTLKYLRCSKSKPAKSFHSAMSSRRLCTSRENVEATLVNFLELEA